MPNAFWQYDILNPHKRGKSMNLRAPDDPLAYEDGGPPVVRSPAVNDRIDDYFAAIREGDEIGRVRAMNDIIDTNRADHAASGVPVYAHTPLPEDFIDRIVEPILKLPVAQRLPVLKSVLEDAGPDRRAVVGNQLNEKFVAANATRTVTPETDNDSARDMNGRVMSFSEKDAMTAGVNFGDDEVPGGGADPLVLAADVPKAPTQPQQQPRPIVKPYRRYAPPGGVGTVDTELQEADAIARDADVTVRKITSKVLGNRQMEQSRDPLEREFARAVGRYFAENGDRAVAAVAPRLKDLSIDAEAYASYSPLYDRIYFTRANRGQSNEEKIITVIHEVLHATLTMKNREAAAGYDRAPKGSIVRAKHEAYVDNVAKQLAKKLGLIPQDYPATDWRRYLKR